MVWVRVVITNKIFFSRSQADSWMMQFRKIVSSSRHHNASAYERHKQRGVQTEAEPSAQIGER